MSIPIHLEITLCTPAGPAGPRLERGVALPIKSFSFPVTRETLQDVFTEAEKSREHLQNYVTKYIIPKHSGK